MKYTCEFCKRVGDLTDSYDHCVEESRYDYTLKHEGTICVKWTVDPFAADVHDDHTLHLLCFECVYDSGMEI
jgi:hypothetical protein